MSRLFVLLCTLALSLALTACQSPDDELDAPKKVAAAKVTPVAPKGQDDKEWKMYLQSVVAQHMDGVTERVFAYYLPANSTSPTPGDPDNRSQYDRQLENVSTVISRTVLPGNMLVFGSPDSAKLADLVLQSLVAAEPDALKGSQVLFIGQPGDSARVQPAVEAVGAKYIFVEAK